MARYIDEDFWWSSLGKPDWYTRLADDFEHLEKLAKQHEQEPAHKQIKGEAYAIVEKAIRVGHIPLASSGDNFDEERRQIDTIVIHHTKNKPGMTLERLNAIQLLRIYGRYYANPTDIQQQHLRGRPVWSGHFYNDEQVFWGYHWLIRENGTCEHILKDEYIGWHAGNWDINTRSIGICIDDDLSNKSPAESVLTVITELISKRYPGISTDHIIGHRDANPQTVCPGQLFRSEWQKKLFAHS